MNLKFFAHLFIGVFLILPILLTAYQLISVWLAVLVMISSFVIWLLYLRLSYAALEAPAETVKKNSLASADAPFVIRPVIRMSESVWFKTLMAVLFSFAPLIFAAFNIVPVWGGLVLSLVIYSFILLTSKDIDLIGA